MLLGIDCDGVLAEQNGRFVECLNQDNPGLDFTIDDIIGRNPAIEALDSDYVSELKRMRAERDDYYLGMEPMDGAVEGMMTLTASHAVWVVTRRPAEFRTETTDWLDSHDVPHDKLVLPAPKNKAKTGVDVIIDDYPPLVETATDHGCRGIAFVRESHLDKYPLEDAESTASIAGIPAEELAGDPARQWQIIVDEFG